MRAKRKRNPKNVASASGHKQEVYMYPIPGIVRQSNTLVIIFEHPDRGAPNNSSNGAYENSQLIYGTIWKCQPTHTFTQVLKIAPYAKQQNIIKKKWKKCRLRGIINDISACYAAGNITQKQ